MINKDFFEGPVGDYCIARNTIKCLLLLLLLFVVFIIIIVFIIVINCLLFILFFRFHIKKNVCFVQM